MGPILAEFGYTWADMIRRSALLFFLLIPWLTACNRGAGIAPTPFPSPGATLTPTLSGPVVLTVTELAAAPGLYRDTQVQLTGLFRKQPVLVCESDPHPPPATWALAEEGVTALAGGFDQEVRSLLPEGLLMTVEGRWRRWEGLVGCGKQAAPREVWYLEVARILSPTTLMMVTLTPPGAGSQEGTAVAEAPTQEGPPTTEGLPTDDLSLLPTPMLEATPESPIATDTPGSYPGLPDDAPGTPTASSPQPTVPLNGTATLDAGGGVATATPTLQGSTPAGTPVPTVTGTPPSPTPSPTGGAQGQVVPKGDLYDLDEEFASTTVAAGTIDSWTIELFEDESLIVHTIAAVPADLVLSVLKNGQAIINRQNTAPAGSPEVINAPTLPGEGIYEIQVSTQDGQAAEYAIIASVDPEYPYIFNGIVSPGSPRSAVQMPADAVHYWFFTGSAGDDFSLRLDPVSGDAIIDLYGPGATYIESIDNGAEGEEEVFELTLTESGLFAIRIMEIDGLSMTYNLAIELE